RKRLVLRPAVKGAGRGVRLLIFGSFSPEILHFLVHTAGISFPLLIQFIYYIKEYGYSMSITEFLQKKLPPRQRKRKAASRAARTPPGRTASGGKTGFCAARAFLSEANGAVRPARRSARRGKAPFAEKKLCVIMLVLLQTRVWKESI
ncbi:MAG: hypothetical protein Q4C13_01895, partial [Clostridia bacterium]|nr:hypothetical protein [Clostridia bacterium]